MEAKSLCRCTLSVQELTASEDGRLGKGKSTRWATAKREQAPPFSSGRFGETVDAQLEKLFWWLDTPSDQRPGGWDVISLTVTVMGTYGATVVVKVEGSDRPWRLGIMIDSSELEYRHNLELLARCPVLQLRCLVRVRLDAPCCGDLLAIANVMVPSTESPLELRLELPEDWQGICNVGIDRLERHFVQGIQRWSEEITLQGENHQVDSTSKFLTPIERRLVGIVLGGRDAIPNLGSKSHRRDCSQLNKLFLPMGAHLLDLLATKAHEEGAKIVYASKATKETQDDSISAFLACDIYQRTTKRSLTIKQWTN